MVVVSGVASTAFVTGAPVANVDKHDDRTRMSIATNHPAIVGHFDFDGKPKINQAHDADYFDEDPPIFGLATSGTNVNSHVGDGTQVIPFTMPVKTCGPGQMAQTNGATIRLGEMVQFEWRNSVSRPPNKFAVPPSVTPKTFKDKGGWRTANPIRQKPLDSGIEKQISGTVSNLFALNNPEVTKQLEAQRDEFRSKYPVTDNRGNNIANWGNSSQKGLTGGFRWLYNKTAKPKSDDFLVGNRYKFGGTDVPRMLIVKQTVSRPQQAHFKHRTKHGAWRSLGVARATPSPVVVHRSSLPYVEMDNVHEDIGPVDWV